MVVQIASFVVVISAQYLWVVMLSAPPLRSADNCPRALVGGALITTLLGWW